MSYSSTSTWQTRINIFHQLDYFLQYYTLSEPRSRDFLIVFVGICAIISFKLPQKSSIACDVETVLRPCEQRRITCIVFIQYSVCCVKNIIIVIRREVRLRNCVRNTMSRFLHSCSIILFFCFCLWHYK